jgi:hypothetical protein
MAWMSEDRAYIVPGTSVREPVYDISMSRLIVIETSSHIAARTPGGITPACQQCGGMMQRTGSCYTCSSCGFNTGCG